MPPVLLVVVDTEPVLVDVLVVDEELLEAPALDEPVLDEVVPAPLLDEAPVVESGWRSWHDAAT